MGGMRNLEIVNKMEDVFFAHSRKMQAHIMQQMLNSGSLSKRHLFGC